MHGHLQFGAIRKFLDSQNIKELKTEYFLENEFIDLSSIINYLIEQKKLSPTFMENPFNALDLTLTNGVEGFANNLAKTYKHILNLKKKKNKPNLLEELQLRIFQ